jgi:hypothetical protein
MERAAAALVADGIRLAHKDQVRIHAVTPSPLQRLVQETASNSPTAGEAKTAYLKHLATQVETRSRV